MRKGSFCSLESVSGIQCSVSYGGESPYGSFGIFWTQSKLEKVSVTECAPTNRASIGIHLQDGNPYLYCCNFTENRNNQGWKSLIYLYLCSNTKILSSVFMNNTSPTLITSGGTVTNYSVFINNNCNSIGSGKFYHCCFYGNSVPSSATLCVSDRIVYMTDYGVCKFGDMTKEFTVKKESKLNILVLLLMLGLV